MVKKFKVKIITPDRIIYDREAVSLVAPSEMGYLGVLVDHAPLIANLVEGKIVVREDTENVLTFFLKGIGFLEVFENEVSLFLGRIAVN